MFTPRRSPHVMFPSRTPIIGALFEGIGCALTRPCNRRHADSVRRAIVRILTAAIILLEVGIVYAAIYMSVRAGWVG